MIKTLGEMLAARTGNITILEQVQLWLSQTDVQELLAAAWDPALAITHLDAGVVDDSRVYAVECTVRGTSYYIRLATGAGVELTEQMWLMAELSLRDHLVDAALTGKRV
jgi:hypothetical protein